jgi:hypothetical protein
MEQEVEDDINDDQEHHDSDDVSGVQRSPPWASALGKQSVDISVCHLP